MPELAQQLRAERLGRDAQRARALGLADPGAGDDHDVLRDQVDAKDAASRFVDGDDERPASTSPAGCG